MTQHLLSTRWVTLKPALSPRTVDILCAAAVGLTLGLTGLFLALACVIRFS